MQEFETPSPTPVGSIPRNLFPSSRIIANFPSNRPMLQTDKPSRGGSIEVPSRRGTEQIPPGGRRRANFSSSIRVFGKGQGLSMARATWSALFGILLATTAVAGEAVPWSTDFRQAAEVAAKERKLLLLHFWSDDCPPCRRLEANVFPREDVATAISNSYVPVKVNVDRAPEMARRFQVSRWPTDVIITPTGQEVYRTVSPQEPARYIAMLGEAASRASTAVARSTAPGAPAANAPGPEQPPLGESHSAKYQPPTIDSGVAYEPRASAGGLAQNGPYLPPQSAAQPSGRPPATAPGQARPTDYGSDFLAEGAGPATSAPSGANPYSSDFMPQSPGVSASERQWAAPLGPSAGPSAGPPAGTVQPQPQIQQNQFAQPPVQQPPRTAPALPPLGMDGYCVITLADELRWAEGDKRFGAIHRGRLYLFASSEAQKKFLADPDRYSPVLAGYDPVRFAESGQLVDGKRAHGLTFNNQVFLFADEESLARFQQSPRPFAETVYQAMSRGSEDAKRR
jgi:thiol-disulfide isomerase/thioredoxin